MQERAQVICLTSNVHCLTKLVNPCPAHISLMIFSSMFFRITLSQCPLGVTISAEPAFQVVQAVGANRKIGSA